jgi:hypothetical protein
LNKKNVKIVILALIVTIIYLALIPSIDTIRSVETREKEAVPIQEEFSEGIRTRGTVSIKGKLIESDRRDTYGTWGPGVVLIRVQISWQTYPPIYQPLLIVIFDETHNTPYEYVVTGGSGNVYLSIPPEHQSCQWKVWITYPQWWVYWPPVEYISYQGFIQIVYG